VLIHRRLSIRRERGRTPYNLHIIRHNDFIRLDGKGGLDLQATKQVLSNLAKACIESGVSCALVDVRRATSPLNLSDLYHLVLAFKEMGFRTDERLAVLHRYSAGEKAEFFAMCSVDHGWNVRAFDEYEDAIEWLSDEVPPAKKSLWH
jgi:hypothetical protein